MLPSTTLAYRKFCIKLFIATLIFLLVSPIIYFIGWTSVYYYDYIITPQLTGVHLQPDRNRWCVAENVIQPTQKIERHRITLILHMSSDYLSEDIAEQFHNWSGPIALSIVLNDSKQFECAVRFIRSIIARHGFRMLQVHFIYKKDTGRCDVTNVHRYNELSCSNTAKTRSVIEIADYPMNMARNVAREFISTDFLLISDVDLMFSDGFERRMSELAKRELNEDKKKVLVFRIFEIYNHSCTPRTKSEMGQLMNNGNADVFHVVSAYGHHDLDGRSDWFSSPENFTHTRVVPKQIRYSRYTWEPRFVGLSSVPFHDESFPYRIRANNVLGWELCRAGYEFSLVEDLFTYHRAKRVSDNKRQNENNLIQLLNRLKYERALSEWYNRMDKEYPNTKGSCPAILRRKLWYFTEE